MITYSASGDNEATILEAYAEAVALVTILGSMLPAVARDLPLPEMQLIFKYKDGTADTALRSLILYQVREETT